MLHEILPADIADTRAQRSRLDEVITQCRDASNNYRAASRVPSAHRDELMTIARKRSALLGQSHLGDSLAACLRSDAHATRSYTRALEIGWTGDIGTVLDAQRVEIERSSAEVCAIRGRL